MNDAYLEAGVLEVVAAGMAAERELGTDPVEIEKKAEDPYEGLVEIATAGVPK